MKNSVLVILCHPRVGSLNHAIADCVFQTLERCNIACKLHSLYEEQFSPVLTAEELVAAEDNLPPEIVQYHNAIRAAAGLVFIHPNWWGGPPAMLRGWIDRVFRHGFAYHFTADGPVPHLADKTVQIFSTSNTPRDVELRVYGDPVESFWKTIVFGLCGSKSFARQNFSSVILSTPDERAAWLRDVEEITSQRFCGGGFGCET